MLVFLFHDTSDDDLKKLDKLIERLSDSDSYLVVNTYGTSFSIECYDNISRHSYKGAEAMNLYIAFRKMKAPVQREDSV